MRLASNDDSFVLSNPLGCQVIFSPDEEGYGQGRLLLDGWEVGKLELLKGGLTSRTKREPPYWEQIPFRLRLQECREEKDSEGGRALLLSGESDCIVARVKISMLQDSLGILFDYELRSFHPCEERVQPLFLEVSLNPPQSRPVFVQYPFQAPLAENFRGEWEILPQRHFVPFIFGCRRTEERVFFLGVGYPLSEDYWHGRFLCKVEEDRTIFRVYPPHPLSITGEPSRFRLILSIASTQAECIKGFRERSGYEPFVPVYRTIDEAVSLLMSVYKTTPAYESGKGYRQKIHPDTGQPSEHDYGKYVPVCANVPLAYNLYKWWEKHPDEEWARERAIEIAEFFVRSQRKDGSVPTLWEPATGRYLTYIQEVKEARESSGKDVSYLPQGPFLSTTHMLSMAAYYLDRFRRERECKEGVTCGRWEEASLRAMNYLVKRISPEGVIGRNFNERGEFDDLCINAWFLIALDYFYQKTGDKKFDRAREKVEKWVYHNFVKFNHWFNWSADGGWWGGKRRPPINHDAFEVPTFATYCIYRYLATKEKRYLQMAEDALAYLWLCMVPIQFPEYKHVTKGLVKEQDFYGTYNVPFNTTRLFDGLPLLSVLTGDKFYAEFYRLLVQTQLAYQAIGKNFPAFYIGLDWREEDKLGEPETLFIVEFAGCVFLDSVNSPYAYRFVGGSDWCVGLDYDPPFKPNFDPEGPFVSFCSSRVLTAWQEQGRAFFVMLDGQGGEEGVLGVKWPSHQYPLESTTVVIGEEQIPAKGLFDDFLQLLVIKYRLPASGKLLVRISPS